MGSATVLHLITRYISLRCDLTTSSQPISGATLIAMSANTRCTEEDLICPSENLKRIARSSATEPSKASSTSKRKKICLERDERSPLNATFSMVESIAVTDAARERKVVTVKRALFSRERKIESIATVVKTLKVACHSINMSLKKLGKCVTDMTQQTIIIAQDNCDKKRNKSFRRCAL